MVIRYEITTPDLRIPLYKYHFVYEKVKEFLEKQYIVPPFGGVLRVCILFAAYKEILQLKQAQKADFIEVTVYTKAEILTTLNVDQKPLTKWEIFQQYLTTYPTYIDTKLCRKAYKLIPNVMEILDSLKDVPCITDKHLAPYYVYEHKVYPIDVVCSILTYKRVITGFEKYYKRKPVLFINSLIEALGNDYAYYAVRKLIKELYAAKLQYIKDGSINLKSKYAASLIQNIDVFEFTYLYSLIMYYTGTSLYILLNCLTRKKSSQEKFLQTIMRKELGNVSLL